MSYLEEKYLNEVNTAFVVMRKACDDAEYSKFQECLNSATAFDICDNARNNDAESKFKVLSKSDYLDYVMNDF